MIRGLYTAATGMMTEMHRMDVVADNLANVDTIGFKGENAISGSFQQLMISAIGNNSRQPIGSLGLGSVAQGTYLDTSLGMLTATGNNCDLMVSGDAYFQVQTPNGVRYTKAGNFTLDTEGNLVTQEGYQVMGDGGAIQLTAGFEVNESGEVYQGAELIGQLSIMQLTNPLKEGNTFYTAEAAVPAENYQVLQGVLERSNVNSIRQMIDMIQVTRLYEANEKALQAQDDALDKAVNQIAG